MLRKLVEQFEDRTELPIEVSEISRAIIDLGCQDEIHFVAVDAEPAHIHGAFARFTYHRAAYGEPIWVTHIPYNARDSLEQQRVVCCKEMVHIFDTDLELTDTKEEVPDFLDKLLGPMTTDDFGLADFMAAKDKVALYQCLPLLFPKAALRIAREEVEAGRKTPEEVADWAKMPVNLVRLMLNKAWDTINGALIPD